MLWLAVACGTSRAEFFHDAAAPAADRQAPAPVIGEPCSAAQGCAANATCLEGDAFPAGYCTHPCLSGAGCPAGFVCIELDESTASALRAACLASCPSATPCRTGYACSAGRRIDDGAELSVCRGATD